MPAQFSLQLSKLVFLKWVFSYCARIRSSTAGAILRFLHSASQGYPFRCTAPSCLSRAGKAAKSSASRGIIRALPSLTGTAKNEFPIPRPEIPQTGTEYRLNGTRAARLCALPPSHNRSGTAIRPRARCTPAHTTRFPCGKSYPNTSALPRAFCHKVRGRRWECTPCIPRFRLTPAPIIPSSPPCPRKRFDRQNDISSRVVPIKSGIPFAMPARAAAMGYSGTRLPPAEMRKVPTPSPHRAVNSRCIAGSSSPEMRRSPSASFIFISLRGTRRALSLTPRFAGGSAPAHHNAFGKNPRRRKRRQDGGRSPSRGLPEHRHVFPGLRRKTQCFPSPSEALQSISYNPQLA